MFELPTSICIDGKQFGIRNDGDYRVILDCFSALQDETLSETERIFVSCIIFYDKMDTVEDLNILPNLQTAVKEMFKFFNCGQDEVQDNVKHPKLVDWKHDEQMIAAEINKVAGQEVRALPYLHWWTFMGFYNTIGEGSFSNIISIRYKRAKGKKLEDYEKEFVRENPQFFMYDARTIEQKEQEQLLKQIWNSGE